MRRNADETSAAPSPRRKTQRRISRAGHGSPSTRGKRGDLTQWTKAELYERARSAGVPQRSSMSKAELVRALQSR